MDAFLLTLLTLLAMFGLIVGAIVWIFGLLVLIVVVTLKSPLDYFKAVSFWFPILFFLLVMYGGQSIILNCLDWFG